MRRREHRPITRHTINLYEGDLERLQALHSTRVGAAKVIRDIIRHHIRKAEEKAQQRLKQPLIDDLEIDLIVEDAA